MITVYGIPNCDTTKKALQWLKKNKIFNRNSTTWKEMSAGFSGTLTEAEAIQLMQEHTSIIKRPIVEANGAVIAGFKETVYETQFLSL